MSFDGVRSVYQYALTLPQSDTERLLQEQLERLGIIVERRTELKSNADDGDAVSETAPPQRAAQHGSPGAYSEAALSPLP